jgi:hypothetical protein
MRLSSDQSDLMAGTRKHRTIKATNCTGANDGNMFEMGVQINSLDGVFI